MLVAMQLKKFYRPAAVVARGSLAFPVAAYESSATSAHNKVFVICHYFNKCTLYGVLSMLRLLSDSISSVLVLVQKQRHVEVYHLKIR